MQTEHSILIFEDDKGSAFEHGYSIHFHLSEHVNALMDMSRDIDLRISQAV